jgi:hypothetical protein
MHKKFQGQWIKHHYFTNDLVKGTRYGYMSQSLMPIKNQPSKNSGKNVIKY